MFFLPFFAFCTERQCASYIVNNESKLHFSFLCLTWEAFEIRDKKPLKMVPKTVQIECPNGVKTKTRKKHVPKSTKIGKVSKKVPKRDPKKITELIFFWVFFGIGALWAPTWPPEPPKEAQGSFQEAILTHFCSNFHSFSLYLCSIYVCVVVIFCFQIKDSKNWVK